MHKNILNILAIFSLAACAAAPVKVSVTNTLPVDRNNELVEVALEGKDFIVLNEEGEALPYQNTQSGILFPATVKAKSTAVYTIKHAKPETFENKTAGRFVPERKDDFAWENDRIAFRMYGPALAAENPSNGVDIWMKRTRALIIDKFYKGDLEEHISYHVDNGEGLDCYAVGHTLGAGGIAPYMDNTVWVGNHFDSYKILENGPLRFTFELTYNKIPYKDLKQTLRVSLDAGSQLNKALVTYEGAPEDMQIAAGITLHKELGRIAKGRDYLAYAENAVSDVGLPSGRTYTAVVVPGAKTVKQDKAHVFAVADYKGALTYYFGGGWSKWGFDTDEAWFNYVSDYAKKAQTPLVVEIK